MKKFKTGLLALALVAGVSGAFYSNVHAAPKQFTAVYDWNHGQPNEFTGTIADAQENYGCPALNTGCASGTLVSGSGSPTATISQN